MNHFGRAAFAAAALALAVPALAEPAPEDPANPTDTTTDEKPTDATDTTDDPARAGQQQRPGDMPKEGQQTAGLDGSLESELDLDDATSQRVKTIVTSAKDQAQTLRTQMKTAIDDLRRARENNEQQAMKSALDRVRGLHNRLSDLETETADRVFANLTLQQQADFALWMVDKKKELLAEPGDQT